MDAAQFLDRRHPGFMERDGIVQAGLADAGERRIEAPRPFGMPVGRHVLIESGRCKHCDGRCHLHTLGSESRSATDVTPVPRSCRRCHADDMRSSR